mmetsp:Transcript_54055/g.128765  ORF Transcript_54055/g.128765 Transcript_54055/m.128765 type:complete len:336 (-) Transcript_54055:9-1016(-)
MVAAEEDSLGPPSVEECQRETDTAPVHSHFVSRLRVEVAAARSRSAGWQTQPSIGTWLGRARPLHPAARSNLRVSFAEEQVDARKKGQQPTVTAKSCESRLVELSVKGTCGKPFTLEGVDTSIVVHDLKVMCESRCELPADQQRLFLKGRQLKDAETLQAIGITDKATLLLVKGATPNGETQTESEQNRILLERQQREARERAADSLILCFECGVNPGRLQTDGLCSICFREMVSREQAQWKRRKEESERRAREAADRAEQERRQREEWEARRQKDTSRCYTCSKKIGLTGFQCRCGYYFCATHRHAEDHGCTFDHKAFGQAGLTELLAPASSSK